MTDLEKARLLIARIKAHAPHILGYVDVGVTKLCLDGFPRSGNSVLWHKFIMANRADHSGPVISHHVHEPSNIRAAILAGVPVVMPFRNPANAIASARLYHPGVGLETFCRLYLDLNVFALNRPDAVLAVPTEAVFGDFNSIIAAANLRFGTSYRPIALPDQEANALIARSEADRALSLHGERLATRNGAPDAKREGLKAAVMTALQDVRAFRACEALYARLRAETTLAAPPANSAQPEPRLTPGP